AGIGTDAEIDHIDWAVATELRSVDPTHAFDQTSWVVIQATLEPLLKIDPAGVIEGVLAESWEQPDPLTINLTLRDGVKFWNGADLTTDDVIYSLEHYIDPANAAENASYFANMDSISATGDRDLQITLKTPQPEFVSYLALGMIIQKEFAIDAGSS